MDAPLVMHVLSMAHGLKNLANSSDGEVSSSREKHGKPHLWYERRGINVHSPNQIVRGECVGVRKHGRGRIAN